MAAKRRTVQPGSGPKLAGAIEDGSEDDVKRLQSWLRASFFALAAILGGGPGWR
jgi:hypothetical protein